MADISYGASFYLGSTNTPGQLSGLISLSMGGFDVTCIETKALDQGSRWKTFLSGFVDGGTVTVKLNYLKTIVTTLMTAATASANYYFKVTLPDTSTLTGTCVVKSVKPFDLPEDDRDTIEVDIQISGAPTWTPV